MGNLEVNFVGVKMRNPVILGSATPSWDGERSNLAWQAGAGGVVPKSLAPPVVWSQHHLMREMTNAICDLKYFNWIAQPGKEIKGFDAP
jgi:dihydroorotate dehydrogenase